MSSLPRYSAPDPSRQRLRLVAALGALAAFALGVGGLVHAMADEDPTPTAPAFLTEQASRPPPPSDSLEGLVEAVEAAEQSSAEARASIRRARVLGALAPEELDWLERRLDAIGAGSAAPAPTAGPSREPPREL